MKQTIRAFALGVFCATLLLAIIYFIDKDENTTQQELSTEEMISTLEQEGYRITNDQHEQREEKVETEKKTDSDQEQVVDEESDTEQTEQQTPDEEDTEVSSYLLVIEPGMSINAIVEYLYAANMISDREAFTTFLTENDYSTKIQIGEFEIDSAMTEKEIANTITNQ